MADGMIGRSRSGVSDAIRAILAAADDSLSYAEIRRALIARGTAFSATGLSGILRNRFLAGEFILNEINGCRCYTLNPAFDAKERMPGRPRALRAKRNDALVNKDALRRVLKVALQHSAELEPGDLAALSACAEAIV